MKSALEAGVAHDDSDRLRPEQKREQLERILHSQTLVGAPGLQRFLSYVALKTIEGQEAAIKEYTLAVTVFGRPPDFDSRRDTLVRTQAHRLRQKLKEYYESEGSQDSVVIELPRGHYVPRFWLRSPGPKESDSAAESVPAPRPRSRVVTTAVLVTAAIGLVFWSGLIAGSHWRPASQPASPVSPAANAGDKAGSGILAELWSGFIGKEEPVVAAYSNPGFLINKSREIFRFGDPMHVPRGMPVKPSEDFSAEFLERNGPLYYADSLTGTGEVDAVCELTRMFTLLGVPMRVRRSGLLTAADLNRANVIFIGSPSVNGSLAEATVAGDFRFEAMAGFKPRREHIVNVRPRPGESLSWAAERDPATRGLKVDYGLISFLPGTSPGTRLAVLAGLATEGTQAAAIWTTSPSRVLELRDKLGLPGANGAKRLPEFFQAVLRVEVNNGDILRLQYVAGRVLRLGQ